MTGCFIWDEREAAALTDGDWLIILPAAGAVRVSLPFFILVMITYIAHAPLVGYTYIHLLLAKVTKGMEANKIEKFITFFWWWWGGGWLLYLFSNYFNVFAPVSLFIDYFVDCLTLSFPVPFSSTSNLKGLLQHGNSKPVFLTVHDMGSNRKFFFLLFVSAFQNPLRGVKIWKKRDPSPRNNIENVGRRSKTFWYVKCRVWRSWSLELSMTLTM